MIEDYKIGSSPFDSAEIVEYDDGEVSLEMTEFSVETSNKDTIHTVLEGQTLQNIAYMYYGDSGLWYKIALANNILNPFSDELYAGQQLIIPSYESQD